MLLNARRIIQKEIGSQMILLAIEDITKHRQLEILLSESEERYRRLFETADDGILLLEKREGNITHANPAVTAMLGYSKKECIGNKLQDIGFSHDMGDFQEIMHTLDRSGIIYYDDVPVQTKVGQTFYADIYMVDRARLVQCNIRDTSVRKAAQEALRESEERFRLITETITEVFWIADVPIEKMLYVNPAYELVWGRSRKSLYENPRSFLDAVHPADLEQVLAALEIEKAGQPFDHEYRITRPDGSIRWIWDRGFPTQDKTGKVIRYVGVAADITERKRAEEALYRRELELRTALSEIKTLKDQLEAENIYFRREIKMRHQFDHILGQSDGLKYVLYRAEQVAPMNTTVLILGETGTGKDLIAAAIHDMSPRKDRPLITVNCAALPGNLIESELFGREKGAFTGADTRQVGRFEIANGSTLCLDEIGELPLEVQAKLLRVIQHNEFERLGSSQTTKVDVRIVATTNRNLEEEVRKGRFREDLYYRLNVFPITVPPLRQRTEDIPLMAQAFIERYSRKLGKQITSIQKETMKALQDYLWPGNVRELESVIERAMILCPGPVFQLVDKLEISSPPLSSTVRTLEETERNQILKTLSETRWRIEGKDGAAAILGLHPSTLRARMHKLGIRRPETKEPD
ncbi:MAG: sigma 54-interacting transcriptional regulator [Thermodesulfobacteriota bacterium]|jgi:PAS domain S-box-containing protein